MRWTLVLFLAGTSVVLDTSTAEARRAFVLFGSGDTIAHRADLGGDLAVDAQQEMGFEAPAIGYRYEYFSVFFLDLATFEGEYVIYDEEEDTTYLPLEEEELAELGTSADELGKPFFYHVPYGWPIVLLLGGLWVFAKVREMKTRTW